MRFFAHDGRIVHGPSPVEELLQLPGFDGDTLVCPVGSEDSADWKPALSYPPFREALLSAAAPPAPPQPPASPARTEPCPSCAHSNPEDSRFCNACGSRMDAAAEPAPPASPIETPRRTRMGALAEAGDELEASAPIVEPEPAAPAFTPPTPVSSDSARKKALIAAFVGAAVLSAGLGWWLLGLARRSKAARPAPPPASPAPQAVEVPPAPAVPAALPTPPETSTAPAVVPIPAPPKPSPERIKPRKRKPKAAPPAPAAEPVSDGGFLLPGIPRRMPSKSIATTKAPEPADDGSTRQILEQFDFCAQLIAQGAYADHFDTCLCADARQAGPYRGRRDVYASALAKQAAAGRLAVSAQAPAIAVDGATAKVTALWKTGPDDAGRELAETWRLEDGLWCRAP